MTASEPHPVHEYLSWLRRLRDRGEAEDDLLALLDYIAKIEAECAQLRSAVEVIDRIWIVRDSYGLVACQCCENVGKGSVRHKPGCWVDAVLLLAALADGDPPKRDEALPSQRPSF